MSELDGLEEIDLGPDRSTGSAKRIRNARKQFRAMRAYTRTWKSALRMLQTKKAKKAK